MTGPRAVNRGMDALLELALAEGFNSKASFHRSFKLYTGKTPSEVRRPRSPQPQVSE